MMIATPGNGYAKRLGRPLRAVETSRARRLPGPLRRALLPALIAIAALFHALPAAAVHIKLPAGPGRDVVYARCRVCHDLGYVIESKGMDRNGWDGLLYSMEEFGVVLTEDEREKVLDYLSTYLGATPPPQEVAARSGPTGSEVAELKGETLFADNCTSCHQSDAKGLPSEFPPLAANPDLFLTHDFPVRVVLFGMRGAITTVGGQYNNEMPPFDFLSDAEIAALMNYVRSHFGNEKIAPADGVPLTADEVAKLRATPMTPREVLTYRASQGGK